MNFLCSTFYIFLLGLMSINTAFAGGSITSGGGLGGAYPAHYILVADVTRLSKDSKWTDFQSKHLRDLIESFQGRSQLNKTAKQQVIEVIFKASVLSNRNFDLVDKDSILKFWGAFVQSELNQRMPNETACRNGVMKGVEDEITKGCGLSLFGVSLAPQGSWLDGLGVQPADTWDTVKFKGKPLSEMNFEQTQVLLRAAYARIGVRHGPSWEGQLERDYLLNFAFRRVFYVKAGLSDSEREKIALEWVQMLMVKAQIMIRDSHPCVASIINMKPEAADSACGFQEFPFKTIVQK